MTPRSRRLTTWLILAALLPALVLPGCGRRRTTADGRPIVRVGSKAFTESAILGEILAHLARSAAADAEHKKALGDTSKVWNALLDGEIDAYCEYTGTLTQEILAGRRLPDENALRAALAEKGLRMSRSLGFSDNYALGMRKDRAEALNVRTISDLRDHPDLRLGLSTPFLARPDGWPGLRQRYQLPFATPNGMEHSLAYEGLRHGTLDVTDLYTTDAEIRQYNLRVLVDDRHFFPAYEAVILYRADLAERAPHVVAALLRLEWALPLPAAGAAVTGLATSPAGPLLVAVSLAAQRIGAISADTMRDLNARVRVEQAPEAQVAVDFLAERLDVHVPAALDTLSRRLGTWTLQHLELVVTSLALAILVAVPLGIVAAQRPRLGQLLLAAVGVVQTLPALALLGFLIVFLRRIGPVPAVVALFLYSLLPIVRNTCTGLTDIPLHLRESAEALGLTAFARLYLIELPLASRSILAGVKTAAVINVGFATLGGLIGAGGYGEPIMVGLSKNNYSLILEGAIPAVLMALAVQALFELVEHFLVPRGLRLQAAR